MLILSRRYHLPVRFAFFENAGVAQLAEHQPSKLRVAGSIPVSRSIMPTLRIVGLKSVVCLRRQAQAVDSGLTLSSASLPHLQRRGETLSRGSKLYC